MYKYRICQGSGVTRSIFLRAKGFCLKKAWKSTKYARAQKKFCRTPSGKMCVQNCSQATHPSKTLFAIKASQSKENTHPGFAPQKVGFILGIEARISCLSILSENFALFRETVFRSSHVPYLHRSFCRNVGNLNPIFDAPEDHKIATILQL